MNEHKLISVDAWYAGGHELSLAKSSTMFTNLITIISFGFNMIQLKTMLFNPTSSYILVSQNGGTPKSSHFHGMAVATHPAIKGYTLI